LLLEDRENLSVLERIRRLRYTEKRQNIQLTGIYTDEFGKTRFYDNETDNYQQDHYQLHWNEKKLSTNWNTNLAFHYTKGRVL
jgi:iron complex outermembrane receptor protein